jgi:hypothetical protein
LQYKQVEFNKELSVHLSIPKNYLRKWCLIASCEILIIE